MGLVDSVGYGLALRCYRNQCFEKSVQWLRITIPPRVPKIKPAHL